jgi:peptidoglycan/xylan/chitin deacetylase (PgdA/CDA1 family)
MKRMADKSVPQWLGIGLVMILSLAVVACAVSSQAAPVATRLSGPSPTVELAPATVTLPTATATPAPPTATATATPTSTPIPKATPDLAKVKPNELGRVPVFVYHLIGDVEGRWTRTPANFRKDLERLYRLGYRTVKLSDYLSGNIDLPAGTSPVVLTFDDSSPNQFRLVNDGGKLVPSFNCAVGILESFAATHPDFGHNATFYILPAADPPHNLFGQDEYQQQKLEYLLAGGYELGNHTLWHQNLSTVSDAEVQRQIGEAVLWVRKLVPQAKLDTIALVQGAWPARKQLAITGTYKGETYRHRAVMMAWGEPAYPFDSVDFDAYAIPRVQGIQSMLDLYLDMLDKQPGLRYVSDGNPRTLTFPTSARAKYDPRKGATEAASTVAGYTTIQLPDPAPTATARPVGPN